MSTDADSDKGFYNRHCTVKYTDYGKRERRDGIYHRIMTLPVIIKADATREIFDPPRLLRSLERSGAGEHTAERIARAITSTVKPGASSKEIYTRAFSLLRKEARPVAARYWLWRALLELGPTGHPF